MFLEVLRTCVTRAPRGGAGWLEALADPWVGRALCALHRTPEAPWTLDALAREAGISRSQLAESFAALVGQPPMQYLARWRLQVAMSRLQDAGVKVSQVAGEVGYGSEAAFSRAFKRVMGVSPAEWRHRHRADVSQLDLGSS
jgi:AraC-like DNA-binding protein